MEKVELTEGMLMFLYAARSQILIVDEVNHREEIVLSEPIFVSEDDSGYRLSTSGGTSFQSGDKILMQLYRAWTLDEKDPHVDEEDLKALEADLDYLNYFLNERGC